MTKELDLCPSNKRNCVSSLEGESEKHFVEAIPVKGSEEEFCNSILQVLRSREDCKVKQEDGGYIHAVFQTKWLKFKDDVEFLYNREKDVVDVRSASRLGHYDFDVNRKRVEELREAIREYGSSLEEKGS
ncbi:hypothetical protein CR205_06640 [Alteribacter lacisalsi]|uniref:DUF1499 domain-containing protein n=1 Tax=Alteribacter lacisalsi TaxID=2045244 RepID=A0A2W0HN13_9BACI|nr:DUF1499 domain-containing protein [Alteribacter lacisalsi]PYZ98269.1 hypothetical protein CR205_06640 [Alteribacter lacisalsi]